MNDPDQKYVFHGSPILFENVEPKRQKRSRLNKEGKLETIFDEISFHATPYKWIALAYTYGKKGFKIGNKTAHYNMGVGLYEYSEKLVIYGFESLEKSLELLYGDGGYLFSFNKEKFIRMEGLGNLEVITLESLKPDKMEKIEDPLSELKKLGVTFKFIDLAKPENEEWRNYY